MAGTAGGAVARVLVLSLALIASAATAAAQPPSPTRWVTDGPRVLSDAARQSIDAQLESYQQQTGHHVLVWIGRTTGGDPIEDFAARAFRAWRVGRTGLDDGVVLFVFSEQRQLRIEVGYGLEGQIPDAIASRIIREVIVPSLQAGVPDTAVQGGVDAILAAIEGRPFGQPPTAVTGAPPSGAPSGSGGGEPLGTAEKVVLIIIGVGFLILFITNPALAIQLLFTILSSGGSGSSGRSYGGGGGYSGGGGRSGGGGASGSW